MLKNNLKLYFRSLINNKSFSIINISGLAVGMASAALILLWVQHEYSFDQFHKNKDRLYEVWNRDVRNGKINCWNTTPKPMAPAIQKDYDEVEKTVRVNYDFPILFTYGEKRIKASCNIVDSGFLQLFTFPLIKGDVNSCLDQATSVVIGKELAGKLFGTEDPIGKTVKLDNQHPFTVTGVLDELPDNTQFAFECLIPWRFLVNMNQADDYWSNNSTTTYALLKPGVDVTAFQDKIKDLRKRYDKESPEMLTFLYPFTRTRLHSVFVDGLETGGRIQIVHIFSAIAFLLLLIACINFMNLSTARSEKRAKEVGIRKVVGAQRFSLVRQFLTESVLIAFLSGCVASLIIYFSLPSFNELVGKKLVLDFANPEFLFATLGFILLTGLLAGSYPALFLASFNPVTVLKGTYRKVQALVTPRKILVVGQFIFSIMLIIATLIIKQQLQHAQNRQAGYDRDRLVVHFFEGDMEKNYLLIKNELLLSGLASSVTKTSAPITQGWSNTWGLSWQGKDPNDRTIIDRFCADDAVVRTTGMEILAGRDFDLSKFPTDSTAAIINESAAKVMGFDRFDQPIGQIVKDNSRDWHIVGVVKDFILHSPFQPAVPMFIAGAKGWFNVMHVRYNKEMPVANVMEAAEKIFKKYNPEYPFNYSFTDDQYAQKFSDERRVSILAGLFAGLTIFISCLGLFGLVSFMAATRTKELGVRKVLGASLAHIVGLLSREFLILVIIAFVIASPLAFWAMNNWLKNYTYRIDIHWWVFGVSGLSIVLIALATVSFQALKAAVANPIKSLRTE